MAMSGLKQALLALPLATVDAAAAQDYPVRPVRLIVGFPPVGAVDLVARSLARGMQEALGQQVIVDNRAGANGGIGTDAVAKATSDGYTLGLGSVSTLVLNLHLNLSTPYQTLRDFSFIGRVGEVASALCLHPTVPARDLKQLVALAKARSVHNITIGSSGVGSLQHLTLEMINTGAKVKLMHVPYKGALPALTDVMGGHIDGLVVSLPGVIGAAKAGKLNVIAVTGDKRSPALPQAPTVVEQGWPELAVVNWYGVIAPAKLPAPVVQSLHVAVGKAMTSTAVKDGYAAAGVELRTDASPDAFAGFVRNEYSRWQEVIGTSGVMTEPSGSARR